MAIELVNKAEYVGTSKTLHTISIPTGAARNANNVAIVNIILDGVPATSTGSGDWIELYKGRSGPSESGARVGHYIKRLTGSDTSFGFNSSSAYKAAATMTIWSGVIITGNPYHVYDVNGQNVINPTVPSITTSVPNCMLVVSLLTDYKISTPYTVAGYDSKAYANVLSSYNMAQQNSKISSSTGATGAISTSGGSSSVLTSVLHLALAPTPDEDPIIIMCGL